MSTAIETNDPRAEWKRARLRGIGASEWVTVLGLNPSKSAFELACEKLGEIEPEQLDDREDIIFGRLLEPVALGELARRTGRTVEPWPQDQVIQSPSHEFLLCTPDALQRDDAKGDGVAETKNRCEWKAKEWTEGPPLLVQVQLQAQLFVTGRTWGSICVIIGGNRFRYFDCERDDRFLSAAVPVLEKFWRELQSGKKPDIVATASVTAAVKKLHPRDNGQEIELPPDYEVLFDEIEALGNAKKIIDRRYELLRNRVRLALENNTYGLLPSGRSFSNKAQSTTKCCPNCKAVLSESTYRVMRLHKPKRYCESISDVGEVTAALLSRGAVLVHESDHGSRYFEMAGGLIVRVSDHEPNEATEAWMGRKEVASVRVDQPDWREALEAITGPLQIEG